jgi:hypothetical protein
MSMKRTISAGSTKTRPAFDFTACLRGSGEVQPEREPDLACWNDYFSSAWISSFA